MTVQTKDIKCPNCGAPQAPSNSICKFCKSPIIISTFTSVADMPIPQLNKYVKSYTETLNNDSNQEKVRFSMGMCYLKLKIYDKALKCFEQAFEDNFDDSEAYFYAAICILGGKKAFLATRVDIDKIIEYIDAANSIAPSGIYTYYLAYIKYDYFKRKYFMTSPNYEEVLSQAEQLGVSEYDKEQFYKILNVERPDCL